MESLHTKHTVGPCSDHTSSRTLFTHEDHYILQQPVKARAMVTLILQMLGSLPHSTWPSQQTAWLQGLITQLLKNAVLTVSSRRQGTVMFFCDGLGQV